jgi:hypothetical protein
VNVCFYINVNVLFAQGFCGCMFLNKCERFVCPGFLWGLVPAALEASNVKWRYAPEWPTAGMTERYGGF